MLDSVDPSALPQMSWGDPASRRAKTQDWGGLSADSFEARWENAKQIPQRGEAAVDDLIALLQDDTLPWDTRWFAARSLGHFDTPTAITALIETLDTADGDLQEAIVQSLSQIGPSAIQVLSTLLPQPTHQAAAIAALARIPHAATQAPLVAAVGLATGQDKARALAALGPFADLALLPLFTAALVDPASAVRLAALQGLVTLKKQVDEARWVAGVQPLVNDVHPTVAERAIHALGRATDPAATQTLTALLAAPHTPDRLKLATVQALIWQETPAALGVIIQAWDTLALDSRIAALQALSRTTNPALQALLIDPVPQWLHDLPATADHSLLRRNLVMLLGHLAGQLEDRRLVSVLEALSRDADAGVRLHAQASLRARGAGADPV